MEEERSKFCCENHLDRAFDDFLVKYETFPNMSESKNQICSYCREQAKYKLELIK